MTKKTILATVALTGLLAFGGAQMALADEMPVVTANPGEGAGQGIGQRMMRGGMGFLGQKWQDLTAEQKTQIEAIRTRHRDAMESLMETQRQEMHQYLLDQGILTQEELDQMEAKRAEFQAERGGPGRFGHDLPAQ